MSDEANSGNQISAAPTKAFFVDMLVRDIALEQAILDLVDNCVDGAKRYSQTDFNNRNVKIEISSDRFRIIDNCGGFGTEVAKNYAFRFGRPSGSPKTPHSIGQFGVGMKRALFKFGRNFIVRSATSDESWAINVDVNEWEDEKKGWELPWSSFEGTESISLGDDRISRDCPGTEIVVTNLRPEVAAKFGTQHFANSISAHIKSKHRQFIAGGLTISVNGAHLDATSLFLLVHDDLKPGVDVINFSGKSGSLVKARIVVGVGVSSPKDAGWYVVCNGRVILEADRRSVTGWGVVESEAERAVVPNYHNQFARFRGVVSFDSDDSSLVPWNTTKTDIDQDNPVWQKTFQRMTEMMRPVIAFLNELDRDVDEYTKEKSPLHNYVQKSSTARSESITEKGEFIAPKREKIDRGPKTVKIQYSRTVDDVNFVQEQLNLNSAKAVGEKTFDLMLARLKK